MLEVQKSELSKENELVLLLSDFISTSSGKIQELLKEKLDWSEVLGQLTYNRTAGLAYEVIFNNTDTKNINRELKFGLYSCYEFQRIRTQAIIDEVFEISASFKKEKILHAFLKGTILALCMYPIGCRASNDIDLLVNSEDVTAAGNLLKDMGFIQGKYDPKTKKIIPATRYEIIESKLNNGEVIPYQKLINVPGLDCLQVDINYSLDWNATGTEDSVRDCLTKGLSYYTYNNHEIASLNPEYFLMHLCMHFYKEAVGLEWVKSQRDLSLYKFIDFHALINQQKYPLDWNKFIHIVKVYKTEKECYYSLKNASILLPFLFSNEQLIKLNEIKPENTDYLNYVIDPKNTESKYIWLEDLITRFFDVKHYTKLVRLP